VKDDNAGLIIGLSVMLLGVVLVGGPMLLGHAPPQPIQPILAPEPLTGIPTSSSNSPSSSSSSSSSSSTLPSSQSAALPSAAGNLAEPGVTAAMIKANNDCVRLLNQGKLEQAIDRLEPLLKANPNYTLGRKNLAIAYNNLGIKQAENPRVALDSFWRSSCLDPGEMKTQENIAGVITLLKKRPKNFDDRVALAEAQEKECCLYGAYCEYSAALALQHNPGTEAKLQAIEKQAKNSSDEDVNGAFFVKLALRPPSAAGNEPDFGPYMAQLQRTIKRHWFPPKKNASKKFQVFFTVSRDGSVGNLKVSKSSGDEDEDQAGLAAIKEIGKFDPLPDGAPTSVDVQFNFDYNVFNSAKTSSGAEKAGDKKTD